MNDTIMKDASLARKHIGEVRPRYLELASVWKFAPLRKQGQFDRLSPQVKNKQSNPSMSPIDSPFYRALASLRVARFMSIQSSAILFACVLSITAVYGCAARLPERTASIPASLSGAIRPINQGDGNFRLAAQVHATVPDAGYVTVPFSLDSTGLPQIDVTTWASDGTVWSGEFLLDTGAASQCLYLTAPLAARLRPWLYDDGTKDNPTVLGSLERLQIGELELRPAPVFIFDESDGRQHAAGAIGLGVLAQLRGVVLDTQSQTVTLIASDAARPGGIIDASLAAWRWIDMVSTSNAENDTSPPDGLVRVIATIAGVESPVILDTGFSTDLVTSRPIAGFMRKRDQEFYTWSGSQRAVVGVLDGRIVLGDRAVDAPEVAQFQDEAGFGVQPIIGWGILGRAPIWIDFANRRVGFWGG